MQKVIIEDITDYKKLNEWIASLDPRLKEEYDNIPCATTDSGT